MWHPNSKWLTLSIFALWLQNRHSANVELKLNELCYSTVYEDGKVCISILHPPGNDAMSGETAEERWRPILSVEAILLSVISMMNDPNINSPANIDASV